MEEISELPKEILPLKIEVISYFLHKKRILVGKGKLTGSLKHSLLSEIVSEVISIWNFATIPTISNANAYKMLERLVDKYQKLQWTTNKQRSLSSQYILFVNDLNVLFDIYLCSCFKPKFGNTVDVRNITYEDCKCFLSNSDSFYFYKDQIGSRTLTVVCSDINVDTHSITFDNIEPIEKILEVEDNLHLLSEEENDSGIVVEDASVEISVIESDTSGTSFVQNISSLSCNPEDNDISIMPEPSKSNYNEYPLMISTAARFGIGKRALCEIGNGLLTDLGILIFYFKSHSWF